MKKSARFSYLILTYIAGLVVFTLFRLVETIAYCSISGTAWDFDGLYCNALQIGWRFDTVVSCYVLALPMLLVIIGQQPERAEAMHNHAFGMIQTSQRMLSEGKTSCNLDL